MLDVHAGQATHSRPGLSRRSLLRVGALGLGGLTLADWFQLKAHGAVAEGKAKSVIQIWIGGGPPQTDTFDPKPEAGEDYCGPYKKTVDTNVPGIRFNEMLPLLAKQADKFAVVRTVTHDDNNHDTAPYKMLSGTYPSGGLVYPYVGCVVAMKKSGTSYKGAIPPFVTVGNGFGNRGNEAGFLGRQYRAVSPSTIVASRGVTEQRQRGRTALLAAVDALAKDMDRKGEWEELDSCQQKAYSLILGDAKKAFDLKEEKEELRERYGMTGTAQSLLLARRLVEYGVPFITCGLGWEQWDTHSNNFEVMNKVLPRMDQCMSALFQDLADRGLLSTTIVTWFGEFGRKPKIDWGAPWNGGRNHWSHCFTALMGGGGFKGGAVVGESDAQGMYIKDRPVYPWDLSASMYQLLGIDPLGSLPHPQGCGQAYVTPLGAGNLPSGGMLKEIM